MNIPSVEFPESAVSRFLAWRARASQRTRYAGDPRRLLAATVEADVVARLRARGYHVARTGHNDHFDLFVQQSETLKSPASVFPSVCENNIDHGLRIEVKASTWSSAVHRYQAALRSNDADVLVLGCQNGALHYFVIPFPALRGLTNIAIHSLNPLFYTGRWRRYLEAWPLLDELIRTSEKSAVKEESLT